MERDEGVWEKLVGDGSDAWTNQKKGDTKNYIEARYFTTQ